MHAALDWFSVHLKDQREKLRDAPVRLYVMGAEEWRDFAAWPPPALYIRYYLRDEKCLSTGPPVSGEPPDHYRYDPADPTPNLGGPFINLPRGAVQDNRVSEERGDVLTYTTPPPARPSCMIANILRP